MSEPSISLEKNKDDLLERTTLNNEKAIVKSLDENAAKKIVSAIPKKK
jgi:hypothetical protein